MRQTFVRAFLRASCEAYMRHGLSTGLRRVRAFRNTYATSTISAARELQANHGAHVGRSADFADFPDDEATQERRQALACTKVRREMSFAHAPADVRSCPEPFPATPRSASCVGIGRIGTSDTTPYVAQPCGLDDTFETIWLARRLMSSFPQSIHGRVSPRTFGKTWAYNRAGGLAPPGIAELGAGVWRGDAPEAGPQVRCPGHPALALTIGGRPHQHAFARESTATAGLFQLRAAATMLSGDACWRCWAKRTTRIASVVAAGSPGRARPAVRREYRPWANVWKENSP
ncbi:hypothetical protein AK812_SmicGene42165 [Symbiodinium microadriaticum]|uniref:Uncharacterized protein n=1 Tax=Symbiodinium microadriaticum TaxID=2951 RepID=A0A1Q9C489_SYMMI|nr:hypothetical protein AK812_SmicGene42165 [Symbiodinium microadriaticum]